MRRPHRRRKRLISGAWVLTSLMNWLFVAVTRIAPAVAWTAQSPASKSCAKTLLSNLASTRAVLSASLSPIPVRIPGPSY